MTAKRMRRLGSPPERIIIEQTAGGPSAAHLKRYEFAASLCGRKQVLDVACGTGYGSAFLARVAGSVVGVDRSADAIAYAAGHYPAPNVRFLCADAHRLPLPDRCVDVVCSMETLEHLARPRQFLAEVTRVLRTDGVMVLSTPRVGQTRHRPPDNPWHIFEYSRADLERLLRGYFSHVEVFGQRRVGSSVHRWVQRVDGHRLRARIPPRLRGAAARALGAVPWHEVTTGDLVIVKDALDQATELVAVCRTPLPPAPIDDSDGEGAALWAQLWTHARDEEFWWWVARETTGVRGRAVHGYIERHLGPLDRLRTIEVGSGPGVYSLVFAREGARVTLLDYAQPALDLARRYFAEAGLPASFIHGDAFHLDSQLEGRFDVAMSFGTVEHFAFPERLFLAAAHLDLVRPGGVVAISVPNRWFLPHELLKSVLRRRGKWALGYEQAASPIDLRRLARALGLRDVEVRGSAFVTELGRYLHIVMNTQTLRVLLPPRWTRWHPPTDRGSPVDDWLGGDLVLLGRT